MAGRAEICLREVNVTTGGRSSATSFHSPARGKPARKTQTSAFALVGDNESFRFFFLETGRYRVWIRNFAGC